MNILIIGLGSISEKHIYSIKKTVKNPVFFGLRSSKLNSKKVKDVQNIFELNELKTKIDFVIISNPTHLHYSSIIKSLILKCPIFIEKPVLSSLENGSKILSLIKKNNIKTYVACNLRFHPLLKFLKLFLLDKITNINEVNVYCGSFLPDWRKIKDFRTSYSAISKMGGGVHLDLIHELDYCTWIFGFPNKVYSHKRSVSSLKISSIDSAIYILEYDSFNININLNYYRTDTKREIEILLENETFKGDLLKNSLINLKTNKIIYKNKYKIMDTYVNQMKYFIDNINHKDSFMNDINEAFSVLKLSLNE